jgi:hypothetical protein
MRKYTKFIVVAGAVAALAAPSAALASGSTTPCPNADRNTTSFADGTVIPNALNVPAGVTCRLGNMEVQGNVTVAGNLVVNGTTFDGNVNVNGGTFAAINWGTHIKGNLAITNSQGDHYTANNGLWSDYAPSVIDGGFSYTGNDGWFYAEGSNTIHGKFTYSGNDHPYVSGQPVPGGGGTALTVLGKSIIS